MTLREAAATLGLSVDTLRWQIHNGKLAARKFGPIWVIERAEVERYGRENQRHR